MRPPSCDGSNLMTPPRPNTHEEGVQRPGCLGRRPSGLDQHGAGVAAADLADAAMVGAPRPDWRTRGFSPK
jgi:hypothetical protein